MGNANTSRRLQPLGEAEFWPIAGESRTVDIEVDGKIVAILSLHEDDHGLKLTVSQPDLPDAHTRRVRVIRLG